MRGQAVGQLRGATFTRSDQGPWSPERRVGAGAQAGGWRGCCISSGWITHAPALGSGFPNANPTLVLGSAFAKRTRSWRHLDSADAGSADMSNPKNSQLERAGGNTRRGPTLGPGLANAGRVRCGMQAHPPSGGLPDQLDPDKDNPTLKPGLSNGDSPVPVLTGVVSTSSQGSVSFHV
jgi:hypothetical protein